jgi:hypothetical protein
MFEDIAPGIQLLGRFGKVKAGIWFLRNGSECVILEMPDIEEVDDNQTPWDSLHEYILDNDLYLKFMTATHEQADHFYSFTDFHGAFPEVPILVHRNFFLDPKDAEVECTYGPADLEEGTLALQSPSVELEDIPLFCFEGEVFETNLAGEPLFLVHAPKYSESDTLVVFRGCLITADWWLGPGDPNYNHLPIGQINNSINALLRLTQEKNYVIHSVFSAHANEFRRNIDFRALMEQSRP